MRGFNYICLLEMAAEKEQLVEGNDRGPRILKVYASRLPMPSEIILGLTLPSPFKTSAFLFYSQG